MCRRHQLNRWNVLSTDRTECMTVIISLREETNVFVLLLFARLIQFRHGNIHFLWFTVGDRWFLFKNKNNLHTSFAEEGEFRSWRGWRVVCVVIVFPLLNNGWGSEREALTTRSFIICWLDRKPSFIWKWGRKWGKKAGVAWFPEVLDEWSVVLLMWITNSLHAWAVKFLTNLPHSSSPTTETNHSRYYWNIVTLSVCVCVCLFPGEIKDVQVPDSVPVDLRAKLMVCLIHLHVFTPLEVNKGFHTNSDVVDSWENYFTIITCLHQGLVSTLMEQSAEEIGDLYLDVAEAYLEEGEYMTALPLLSALVISEKYNLAVVWLRHAGETNRKWKWRLSLNFIAVTKRVFIAGLFDCISLSQMCLYKPTTEWSKYSFYSDFNIFWKLPRDGSNLSNEKVKV